MDKLTEALIEQNLERCLLKIDTLNEGQENLVTELEQLQKSTYS